MHIPSIDNENAIFKDILISVLFPRRQLKKSSESVSQVTDLLFKNGP
jgi:hypothetical protein